jgi:hypothetical protein
VLRNDLFRTLVENWAEKFDITLSCEHRHVHRPQRSIVAKALTRAPAWGRGGTPWSRARTGVTDGIGRGGLPRGIAVRRRRPFAQQVSALHRACDDAVSAEDLPAMARQLLDTVKAGDLAASPTPQ